MTAFNRQGYIGEAIESVLASDFGDFELVIVDDCSSDDTYAMAETYAAIDPRIRLFRNDINTGDYPNRNIAAGHARGDYLKYVDSDDRIYPWGLGAMARCLDAFPEAGLGLSTADVGTRPHPVMMTPREAYLGHFIDGRGYFGRAPGSAIIRRTAFEACGGFTGARQIGDHEFWLILCRRFAMVTMPRDLIWDRVHGEQELAKDSIGKKATMHFDVDRAALSHPDCPLSEAERGVAIARLRNLLARTFWRSYFLRGRLGAALQYKVDAGLTLAELAAVLRS